MDNGLGDEEGFKVVIYDYSLQKSYRHRSEETEFTTYYKRKIYAICTCETVECSFKTSDNTVYNTTYYETIFQEAYPGVRAKCCHFEP